MNRNARRYWQLYRAARDAGWQPDDLRGLDEEQLANLVASTVKRPADWRKR